MAKKKSILPPDDNAALPPMEEAAVEPKDPTPGGDAVEVVVVRSLIYGASTLTPGGRVSVPETVAAGWVENGLAVRA